MDKKFKESLEKRGITDDWFNYKIRKQVETFKEFNEICSEYYCEELCPHRYCMKSSPGGIPNEPGYWCEDPEYGI